MTTEQFTKALKALSEPNRLEILRIVSEKQGESGVKCTAVLAELEISQSTFSHHVTELREADIILGQPEGRTVLLTVNHDLLDQIQEKMKNLI